MDKVEKFLRKLPKKQRKLLQQIIQKILSGDLSGLDVKKLTGYPDFFRVRKGEIRILFKKMPNGFRVIKIEKRGDDTYNL